MYNTFFRLTDDPFRLTADPAYLYMSVQHREALSGLVHTLCNRSGLTVLVGEAGTGKTTLLHALRSWLDNLRFFTALCTNPILKQDELYDLLLSQLGVGCGSGMKNRQLAALEETLKKNRAEGRRSVLIVDEAHRLSPELLEEIRLLLNLETPHEKLLEIIIAGQPELADILRRNDLRQLKQRVNCFCRLTYLTPPEVQEYVEHRLATAGLQNQKVFPAESLKLIAQFSQGIPRIINSLCDSAMQTAFALESHQVTCSMVEEAATDLDLLRDEPLEKAAVPPSPSLETKAGSVSVSAVPVNNPVDRWTEMRLPFESYANRQKSISFLSSLMERWK